jgi:two-component system chemotaxis sensor kinase CheA
MHEQARAFQTAATGAIGAGTMNPDLGSELLTTFKVEAAEHIRTLSAGLSELAKEPTPERHAEIVELIFREAHNLKGGAWIVNLTEIQSVCQTFETIFAAWKYRTAVPTPELLALLHRAVDVLDVLLAAAGGEQRLAEMAQMDALVQQIEFLAQEGIVVPQADTPNPGQPAFPAAQAPAFTATRTSPEEQFSLTQTVRVSVAHLDALFLQAEELVAVKRTANQRLVELRELCMLLAQYSQELTRVRSIGALPKLVAEPFGDAHGQRPVDPALATPLAVETRDKQLLDTLEERSAALLQATERDYHDLTSMLDQLRQDMKQLLLVPCASLLEPFSRLTRQLAQEAGKAVDLVIRGGEIKVDRRILEEVKESLIHLLRNCIEHGIELPDERLRKKKPPQGTILLAIAEKNGKQLEILIADDGAGIDTTKVSRAAKELGLLSDTAMEAMDEQDVPALIFQSGLSTSSQVSNLSGRGLGMAIVQEKVEQLGGIISLETRRDVGTTFRLLLPLTLSSFRGILVRIQTQHFIIPTTYVERVMRVQRAEIRMIENKEAVVVNGQLVALVQLCQVLELPPQQGAEEPADKVPVVIVGTVEKLMAFQVDEILSEQEVLLKSLGPQLVRVRNLAGATVLGTGQVVPILNVPDLMKSAVKVAATLPKAAPAATQPAPKRHSILVVEDSITARTQLKNILELAGYTVKTAVDGMDALAQLRTTPFDLVVSDVDMPRMNGFDLTAAIRANSTLAALPVVLVTALDSRHDRERGLEVGANAYVLKRSFDQNNLLEIIRQLI